MILWLVFGLLLAATLAALLYPLLRATSSLPARADYDLKIFRNQLAEVDMDVERGIIPGDQADAARLEIHRRMLSVVPERTTAADGGRARMSAAIMIALVVPLGAGLLYASWGNPLLPDRPYADRLKHEPAVILSDAAYKLNAQLSAKPSAPGYLRLAQLYSLAHDYAHATYAYRRAIQLGDGNAFVWGALGESIVLNDGGALTPDALTAFSRALELDAREPRARFYAGVAEAEIGNLRTAIAIWRDLEKDSKADAPWLPLLRREITTAAQSAHIDPRTVPPTPASASTLGAAVAAMKKAMDGGR